MNTATISRPAELELLDKPRRGRKPQEKSDAVTTRFFMGDADAIGISLKREFGSEVEAQLESLKLNQPYYTIESWKAVADLSQGSIAVQKRAVSTKT
jgi:hypothetical protein